MRLQLHPFSISAQLNHVDSRCVLCKRKTNGTDKHIKINVKRDRFWRTQNNSSAPSGCRCCAVLGKDLVNRQCQQVSSSRGSRLSTIYASLSDTRNFFLCMHAIAADSLCSGHLSMTHDRIVIFHNGQLRLMPRSTAISERDSSTAADFVTLNLESKLRERNTFDRFYRSVCSEHLFTVTLKLCTFVLVGLSAFRFGEERLLRLSTACQSVLLKAPHRMVRNVTATSLD